jgi:hypothetical protein
MKYVRGGKRALPATIQSAGMRVPPPRPPPPRTGKQRPPRTWMRFLQPDEAQRLQSARAGRTEYERRGFRQRQKRDAWLAPPDPLGERRALLERLRADFNEYYRLSNLGRRRQRRAEKSGRDGGGDDISRSKGSRATRTTELAGFDVADARLEPDQSGGIAGGDDAARHFRASAKSALDGLQRQYVSAPGISAASMAAALLQRVVDAREKAHVATGVIGRYLRGSYRTPHASVRYQQRHRPFPATNWLTFGAGRQLQVTPMAFLRSP